MSWNWFSDNTSADLAEHRTKFEETLVQFNTEGLIFWKLNKVPEDWKPYKWTDDKWAVRQEFLEQIRDFTPATLNEVSSLWKSYWPTFEAQVIKSMYRYKWAEEFELKEIEPVDKRCFLEKFKNTLDLSVVNERVKNIGHDPGYSITDEEYTHALNRVVDKKWTEDFHKVYRLNIGLIVFAAFMSTVSDQPGFYWGVLVTGAVNLWRTITAMPNSSKIL